MRMYLCLQIIFSSKNEKDKPSMKDIMICGRITMVI